MYGMSSHGQHTRGGLRLARMGEGLATPHLKKSKGYGMLKRPYHFDRFFGGANGRILKSILKKYDKRGSSDFI
jgi:hypothetical protein